MTTKGTDTVELHVDMTAGKASDAKTADGDKVLITNGTEGQRGWYTVVTEIAPGNNRTELVVPEDLVKNVERVTESVSDQTDA